MIFSTFRRLDFAHCHLRAHPLVRLPVLGLAFPSAVVDYPALAALHGAAVLIAPGAAANFVPTLDSNTARYTVIVTTRRHHEVRRATTRGKHGARADPWVG